MTKLKPIEVKATLVTIAGETSLHWQHLGWGPATRIMRNRRLPEGTVATVEHVVVIGHTREVVRRGPKFAATLGAAGGDWRAI